MLLYIIALCKNQERPDKLELDEQRIITEYLTRRATFLHKKELLFLLLVNRTEWPPITKAPLTKIQFRRLWDLVSKRQAKERVYYRYINGVKTPFKVEAKLGEKSKHGNCVYSIDFEVTPHILRHTYVSNLLLAGVDIKTVQYLAGHEKSKTTLDIYAHLAYNKPEDTITKVRKAFGQPSAQESV